MALNGDAEGWDAGGDTLVDWRVASRHIPGGAAGVRRVAGMVRDECPRLVERIRQGLAEGEAKDVRLAAHTLRGAVLHLGAAPVVHVAAEMQERADAGDLDAVRRALPSLEALVDRLTAELADAVGRGGEPPG